MSRRALFILKAFPKCAIDITDGVLTHSCQLIKLHAVLTLISSKHAKAIVNRDMLSESCERHVHTQRDVQSCLVLSILV